MAKVAINGLGRIGRATLKLVLEQNELELVAVNDLGTPEQLAYLLRYDSVYGRFPNHVRAGEGELRIDNRSIRVLNEKDPEKLPWGDLGIDLVFECTGIFTDPEGVKKHIAAGAKRAILSAPSKGDGMPFVVPGVNHAGDAEVFSTASCTTNCITPVIEILGRHIGVRKAILNSVHAYTSSQSIVDGPAKKFERGRAAAANLVPTSTGAARATGKVISEFQGRFDGIAIRVPVAVGSIADVTAVAERPTSVEEVNEAFRREAGSERYRDVVGVIDEPIVSADIIQDPRASIVDLRLTRVVDGDLVKVMAWYDNEWGYAAQMVREAVRVAGG